MLTPPPPPHGAQHRRGGGVEGGRLARAVATAVDAATVQSRAARSGRGQRTTAGTAPNECEIYRRYIGGYIGGYIDVNFSGAVPPVGTNDADASPPSELTSRGACIRRFYDGLRAHALLFPTRGSAGSNSAIALLFSISADSLQLLTPSRLLGGIGFIPSLLGLVLCAIHLPPYHY